MNITEKINKDNWVATIEVELSADEIKSEEKTKIEEIRNNVSIPGFRKGKVPVNFIKSKYDKMISEDLTEDVKRKYIGKVLEEKKDLKPVRIDNVLEQAELDIKENNSGAFLKFDIVIYPIVEIDKPAYSDLEVAIEKKELAKDDIEESLKRKAEEYIEFKEMEEVPADNQNIFVNTDIDFKKDGEEISKLKRKNFTVNINSNDFPKFKENVIGMKVNEEKTWTVKIDKKDGKLFEEYIGKTLELTAKIFKIKERIIPEINEELAIKAGYESLKEMREKTETELKKKLESEIEAEKETKLFDKIIENCPFNVPEDLIEYELENQTRRLSMVFKNIPIDYLIKMQGYKDINEWKTEQKPLAEKSVKKEILLQAIIKAENFEVDKETLDIKLEEEAKKENKDKTEFKRWLINNKYYENWKLSITDECITKQLLEKTKFVEENKKPKKK